MSTREARRAAIAKQHFTWMQATGKVPPLSTAQLDLLAVLFTK